MLFHVFMLDEQGMFVYSIFLSFIHQEVQVELRHVEDGGSTDYSLGAQEPICSTLRQVELLNQALHWTIPSKMIFQNMSTLLSFISWIWTIGVPFQNDAMQETSHGASFWSWTLIQKPSMQIAPLSQQDCFIPLDPHLKCLLVQLSTFELTNTTPLAPPSQQL